MKINIAKIEKVESEWLYWTRILFSSETEAKESSVFVCASGEYKKKVFQFTNNEEPSGQQLKEWANSIAKKWSEPKVNVLGQKMHYDIYPTEDTKCLNFLESLPK